MSVIHNFTSKSLYKESTDIQIIDLIKITNKFIKNNPNIIFIRADKNITVALEKTEYLNKIEETLNNTKTYEKINKDPTKKFTNEIREVLTVWKKKGYIIDKTYN